MRGYGLTRLVARRVARLAPGRMPHEAGVTVDAVALVAGLLQIVLLQSPAGDGVAIHVRFEPALVHPLIHAAIRAD